ncbi:MAG: chemotaxis protein CheB, partial [Kangiellaceae bacterium]
SIDDDHWHDNVDSLLDESEASIYFNEPGSLLKEEHPEYWCRNLVSRLYEVSGLEEKTTDRNISNKPNHLDEITEDKEDKKVNDQAAESDTSVSILDSALDELQTSSVGLSSEIAAELVSELEDISPQLDTTTHTFDEDTFSSEEALDFLDTAIISHEEKSHAKLNDTVENDTTDNDTRDNESSQIEEIDFSNLVTPTLESARDENLEITRAEFALEEAEPDSSGEEVALATSKEYEDAHAEKLKEYKSLEESMEDLNSDLTVENIGSGKKTVEEILKEQEKENYLEDEIELEGLSIDLSLEDEKIEVSQGKAEFNLDEKLIHEDSEVNEEDKIPMLKEKLELTDLSLENEQVIGRANFMDDEAFDLNSIEDEKSEDGENRQSSLIEQNEESNELTLESTEEVITGRAVFLADEPEDETEDLEQKNEHEQELDDALARTDLALEIESLPVGKANFEIDTSDDIDSGIVEDLQSVNESEIANEDEISFEIPMLEDTATGIDFNIDVKESAAPKLTPCWIIGASLGGPAAVKRFMQNIPADINASFIVVQHIDENFLPVLADILTSNSHFDVQVASGSSSLTPGSVFLAPLKGKLTFLRDGSMLVDHSQSWSAPYSPCIDDVIESISSVYGDQCGAIIFSGMGQDGFQGSKKLKEVQGEVWAQSIETCANASMPQAVINAGLTNIVGTPEMLADRLVQKLGSRLE